MRIFKYAITFIISLLMMSCYMNDCVSKETYVFLSFIKKYGQPLAKEYGVILGPIGGGTNNGFWLMNINFIRKGNPVDINEARRMIIPLAQRFLKGVNANEEIRPYLRDYPFSVKNLDLAIIYYDAKGYETFSPGIGSVNIVEGKLLYFVDMEENSPSKCVLKETYEEALEKLQQEKIQIDNQSIE